MGGWDEDRLVALAAELDEASATMAALAQENEALRDHLGATRAAPASRPSEALAEAELAVVCAAPTSAYRSEDRAIALERALEAAQAAVAELRIENAILKGRLQRGSPERSKGTQKVVAAALVAAVVGVGCGAIWLVTENVGMLLAVALLVGMFWGITSLIGAIEPVGSGANAPRPPLFPPSG